MKRWKFPASNSGRSDFAMFGGWQKTPAIYDMRAGRAFEMYAGRLVCVCRCNGFSWGHHDVRWKPQHHEIPCLPKWPRGVWS